VHEGPERALVDQYTLAKSLEPREQQMIQLCCEYGLSPAQIAELLGLTIARILFCSLSLPTRGSKTRITSDGNLDPQHCRQLVAWPHVMFDVARLLLLLALLPGMPKSSRKEEGKAS
jgi:hypothetical protein